MLWQASHSTWWWLQLLSWWWQQTYWLISYTVQCDMVKWCDTDICSDAGVICKLSGSHTVLLGCDTVSLGKCQYFQGLPHLHLQCWTALPSIKRHKWSFKMLGTSHQLIMSHPQQQCRENCKPCTVSTVTCLHSVLSSCFLQLPSVDLQAPLLPVALSAVRWSSWPSKPDTTQDRWPECL